MSSDPPGFELPLRLLLGFRTLIDDLHAELVRQGHPEMRPMHGFVFQAIGPEGTTAVELGRRARRLQTGGRARRSTPSSSSAMCGASPTAAISARRSCA